MMAIAQIFAPRLPGRSFDEQAKTAGAAQATRWAGAKPRLHKKKPDRKGRDQSGLEGQRERLKR